MPVRTSPCQFCPPQSTPAHAGPCQPSPRRSTPVRASPVLASPCQSVPAQTTPPKRLPDLSRILGLKLSRACTNHLNNRFFFKFEAGACAHGTCGVSINSLPRCLYRTACTGRSTFMVCAARIDSHWLACLCEAYCIGRLHSLDSKKPGDQPGSFALSSGCAYVMTTSMSWS